MKHLLLVAAAALALSVSLASCSDMFSPPELPDLHKDPYDFGVVIPPYKGDGGVEDLAGTVEHDLAQPID
ncbi:MAG TPA: hypothetical protein VF997_18435 [Polyangia bacterium]